MTTPNSPLSPPSSSGGPQGPNRVQARQARLIAEFQGLPDWEARYKRLIDHGKALKEMPKELYQEENKVKGCQSQVWLHASLNSEKSIVFKADSDALIVKGLVALLVETFSEATPEEILSSSPTYLKDLGFEGHLSPSRANGLYAMLKQIFYYATAFQALLRMQK